MKRYSPEYDEEYVKNLLGLVDPGSFASLKRINPSIRSPDLIDSEKSIGVEVTNGLSSPKFRDAITDKKEARNESRLLNFEKQWFGSNDSFSHKKEAYNSLPGEVRERIFFELNPQTKKYFFWSFSGSKPSYLTDSICYKLKKLNSEESSFINLKEIDLFILAQGATLQFEEMENVKRQVENYFKIHKFVRNFHYIFVSFLSPIYKLQLFGKLEELEIDDEILRKALQMTNQKADPL